MELELIEPELYFMIVESAATTLADDDPRKARISRGVTREHGRDRPRTISWSVSEAQREEASKIHAWSRQDKRADENVFYRQPAASVRAQPDRAAS